MSCSANKWIQHFECKCNKLHDNVAKSKFVELLYNLHKDEWIFMVNDVIYARKRKKVKLLALMD